jgi:hypothetical protein
MCTFPDVLLHVWRPLIDARKRYLGWGHDTGSVESCDTGAKLVLCVSDDIIVVIENLDFTHSGTI